MAADRKHVRPKHVSKQDASAALVAGWGQTINKLGKGTFADAIQVDAKTVSRTMSGESTPELHTALNSLFVDPTALDALFALYGIQVTPLRSEAANDLATVSGISMLAGKWAEALSDGVRCPKETCDLSDAIRPLMKALSAVCAEADTIRGVA